MYELIICDHTVNNKSFEGEKFCGLLGSSGTVQLTGNVAGTRTTRQASTRKTREGTGSPRGAASKTKTTRELNYSQFTRKTSPKGPGTIMIQPIYKIRVTEHSDMQLQHICTLY